MKSTSGHLGPNPKVDFFFNDATKWRKEMETLRLIVLECPLTEELKWGKPCYTRGESNVVILHCFKEYCALLFPKGALLKDSKHLLIQQTVNVQAARQLRFSSVRQIDELASVVRAYLHEAIEVEKSGLEVKYKETSEFAVPEELQTRLDATPALKAAFEALTPGRQRGYLLYFSAAKQSKTREARIEKCLPDIFAGKGLMDLPARR